MYFLLIIACLLSTVHVNGYSIFFSDDTTYNPCRTGSGIFFYPHQSDINKYYQCDEYGNAYLRSCGDLVWDELSITCNWPSAVVASPAKVNPIVTTTTGYIPWIPPSWPTTTPSWPSTTPSWPSTTTQSSSTSAAPSSLLCTPINPCGEHGQCLESPITVPSSARRFACICSENWFGRLCDKNIDELTTPPTIISDQNQNISQIMNSFALPVKTVQDPKYIFYGLKASNQFGDLNQPQKRRIRSNSKEEIEVTTPVKKIF